MLRWSLSRSIICTPNARALLFLRPLPLPSPSRSLARKHHCAWQSDSPPSYSSAVKLLIVPRLSFYTTEEGLRRLFSPFGSIKEVRLIKDPSTRRPKGFGFVSYESEGEADRALKALNGRIVDGRLIFVEFAQTKGPKKAASSQEDASG